MALPQPVEDAGTEQPCRDDAERQDEQIKPQTRVQTEWQQDHQGYERQH